MDFRFTDEQRMLADTATAFMNAVSDSASIRAAMVSDDGFDRGVFQRLCQEMYWQGIIVEETHGGLGLGFVELVIALEAMGEYLHCSPLYSCCLSALALRQCAPSEHRNFLLEQLCAGSIVALAHTHAAQGWAGVGVDANPTDDGWVLTGEARFVSYGHAAEHLLVAANTSHGLALFALPAGQPNAICERVPTLDQTRAMATLRLDGVHVSAEQCLASDAQALLAATIDAARILVGADQVGGARRCVDISVDYVTERVQFGRSIASFQAIKHKAADMMVKAESARSVLYGAACIADEWLGGNATPVALQEAAAMVSASAGETYFFCAGSGIQLHGGVGITEEYDIQLYFKRARSTEDYLGNPASQRERIAQQLLDGEA